DLTRAHLLTEHKPGRYAFHDLLRAYATELVHAHHTGAERHTVVQRMLDHYLHTANVAAHLTHPYRESITLPAALPGVTPRTLTDQDHATEWFAAEHATLVAAVRLAADNGFDTHTWQLAWTLVIFLDRHGHRHDHVAVQLAAVAAAERQADPLAQGH